MFTQTHQKIHSWYAQHGRKSLPWRNTEDPYLIYLSEVMLQQTQVKTVLDRFYYPFLERFPTLESLALAPLDDVLKMWEGLGYYSRAKNLHATAQILSRSSYTLPTKISELVKLPGIGPNTAHAIAAFAYRQPLPVMEANVKRILCRLYQIKNPAAKLLWEKAYQLLDKKFAFDHNQAMMDIGSQICLPRNPHCKHCPLLEICQGSEEPHLYPLKKRRKIPVRETDIVIYCYEDRFAMRTRREKFLHGLWGFYPSEALPCASEYIGEVSQQYSHFKQVCQLYRYDESREGEDHYFTPQSTKALAISKIDEKIIKLLLQFENK